MRWFKAEEPTHEERMETFRLVDKTIDALHEAGMEPTAGRVQDVLNAKGTPVDITEDDGKYIVKRQR